MSAIDSHLYITAKILVSIISSLFHSSLVVILLFRLSNSKKTSKAQLLVFAYVVSLSVAFALNAFGVGFFNNWDTKNNENIVAVVLLFIYSLLVTLATPLSYGFFVMQLYVTFDGSILKISNKTIFVHVTMIIIIFVLSVLSIISFLIIDSKNYSFGRTATGIYILLYMIGVSHMIYIINRRLFLLCISHSKLALNPVITSNSTRSMDGDQQDNFTMNQRELQLLKVITKLSVTCFMVIFLSVTIGLTQAMSAAFGNNVIIVVILYCLMMMLLVILSFCYFLILSVNESVYHCFCGICHKKCVDICTKMAKDSIHKNQEVVDSDCNSIEL